MSVFSDIAVTKKNVTLEGGASVSVRRVSLLRVAELLEEFPALGDLANGRLTDLVKVVSAAPKAMMAIIAAGVGKDKDEETLKEIEERLGIYDQIRLIEGILEITLPGGTGPLGEVIKGVGKKLGMVAEEASPEISKESLPASSGD